MTGGRLFSEAELAEMGKLTVEAINNALRSTKNLDMGGVFPPLTISQDASWIIRNARLVQWQDHKVSVLSDWQDGSLR